MPTYLDNAATSFPKPECVYDAVDRFMRNNGAAFGRGSYSTVDAASQIVSQCRHRVAQILDAESDDRIAFTFNCTDGLNLLLRGLLNEGDRVVTTTLEHNSVLRPLRQLEFEKKMNVVHVSFDPTTGLLNEEEFFDKLGEDTTRLVVLNHASNVTGTIQNVETIAKATHEAGALILLDAAQTVGHIPVSVKNLDIDLLSAPGHKGLPGPLGTGFIYVRNGLEDQLCPIRSGGTGTVSESIDQPAQMPAKFESGNLNMPGIAGLNAAAEWLIEYGPEKIHAKIQKQTVSLTGQLKEIPGVTVFAGAAEKNIGIVSFSVDGADCREVAAILDQSFEIQCRAGLHCAPLVHQQLKTLNAGGTIRLSPGVFTTADDIEKAVSAVSQIASSFML